ncbi:MAG: endonuclease domain-containing protein [Sulfuritalea sp.]|nr:endonuclease domain-containing protein [Sulfuritalea sp.]
MSLHFPESILKNPRIKVAAITPTGKAINRPRSARIGATPHDLLWEAVSRRFPAARREYPNVVPGRKFRLDIALPDRRLAIEVDGWEWHGKHKGDFERDRQRQNLLTIHGWRILRFTAGQIQKEIDAVLATLEQACAALPGEGAG